MKEIVGKRKEHSLETSDRKLAERRFKDWAANLNKVDTEAEKTTLAQLVDKFKKTREGLAFKTRKTEQWILGTLEEDWAYGWGIQVSRIRRSMLDEWLAKQESRLKNSSYDRVTLLLKQLFDLAVNDRIIAESPFYRLQRLGSGRRNPIGSCRPTSSFASLSKAFGRRSAMLKQKKALIPSNSWGSLAWAKPRPVHSNGAT
jgi:hypothetical protein